MKKLIFDQLNHNAEFIIILIVLLCGVSIAALEYFFGDKDEKTRI